MRHFTERKQPVQFTRSRAYHKNDNAHIEQKNWTHVRQWLGYERLDNPRVVPLLNNLYTKEWKLSHNFFCPSVKLIAKERIESKTIKHHDTPKTPYQRIMESPLVQEPAKLSLSKQLENLNPFLLQTSPNSQRKGAIFWTIYQVFFPASYRRKLPLLRHASKIKGINVQLFDILGFSLKNSALPKIHVPEVVEVCTKKKHGK